MVCERNWKCRKASCSSNTNMYFVIKRPIHSTSRLLRNSRTQDINRRNDIQSGIGLYSERTEVSSKSTGKSAPQGIHEKSEPPTRHAEWLDARLKRLKKRYSFSVLDQLLCDRSSSLSTGSCWSAAKREGLSLGPPRSVNPLVSSWGLRGVDFGVGVRLSSRAISGAGICSTERCWS